MAGPPIGNQNAAKKDQMARMLNAALHDNDRQRLRAGIESVANAFAAGDKWAIEFAFERIDGKLKQTIAVESATSAEERLSELTALIAEAAGLEAPASHAGLGEERSVVPSALPAQTH